MFELAPKIPAKYIGKYISMMGSRIKYEALFSHSSVKKVSRQLLDKVCAPISSEIRVQTPDEIAVSVLAQIIKVCRSSN